MARRANRAAALGAAALICIFAVLGCESKPEEFSATNPFDPDNPGTGGDPLSLTVNRGEATVELTWADPGLASITSYVIYRMHDREDFVSVMDTVAADDRSWTDDAPPFWTNTSYRIAAVDGNGTLSDTSGGRGLATVEMPPRFTVGNGSGTSVTREVDIHVDAIDAEMVTISDTITFAGATAVPYDTLFTWMLPPDILDTTNLYMKITREGDSEVLAASVIPARTGGSVVLAGGDSLTIRSDVECRIAGSALVLVELSEDSLFAGPLDSLSYPEPATVDTVVTWAFSKVVETKSLFARFHSEFGLDTTAGDIVEPDRLDNISVTLANAESTTTVCLIPVAINAGATLMNVTGDFSSAGWVAFASKPKMALQDSSAGPKIIEIQLANDFIPSLAIPARDTIEFTPTELSVAFESPATDDSFSIGDSLNISGAIVPASCSDRYGETVEVHFGGAAAVTTEADASWSLVIPALDSTVVDSIPADSSATAAVIAVVLDGVDTVAVDTVLVQIR